MQKVRRIVIRGRVQGVGFRWEALKRTRALGLTGSARNCPDGSVEIVTEGTAEALEAFTAWCRRGPQAANVTTVEVEAVEPTGGFAEFTIL